MKKITSLFIGVFLLSWLPSIASTAEITYYHTDALGTPMAMTDSTGKVVWRGDYYPFGEEYLIEQTPVKNKRHFTGKEKDEESGLHYFGARYMDEASGRFVSPDPVTAVDPQTSATNTAFLENPLRLNRYVYGLNNPYRYIDPDGNIPLDTIWDTANVIYDIATGDKAALAADTAALFIPYVPAGISKVGKIASKGIGRGSNKAPDFVVSPGGTAFPVPKGATGPTSVVNPGGKTTGSAFTGGKGGANGQVDTMRIMDPTPSRGKSPGYPNGYIKYENKAGQGVAPYTGRTLPNKDSHFPID